MDASQYKDYVLFMLFIKYVSDKYGDSDDFAPSVTIPKGASFKEMVAFKGDSDIGNKINTRVIQHGTVRESESVLCGAYQSRRHNGAGTGIREIAKLRAVQVQVR